MAAVPVDLSELVDLEWCLQRDATRDRAELERRDAGVGRRARQALGVETSEAAASRRSADFRRRAAQLFVREEARDGAPGAAIRSGLGFVGSLALAVGALGGFALTRGVLDYDGSQPVNVLWFLGALIVGPLLLLLISLVAAIRIRAASSRIASVVERLATSSLVRRLAGGGRTVLQTRSAGLSRVLRLHAFAVAQRLGVAFQLAATLACLQLVAFSDLAFGWGTTLDVDASDVHAAVRVLASPWSWFWPDASPSAELVEASRWVRLSGGFADATLEQAVEVAPRWWSFLVACLVVYGLLPRLALWWWAGRQARRSVQRVELDEAQHVQLFDRLFPAAADWDAADPDDVRGAAPRDPGQSVQPDVSAATTFVIAWGRLGADPDRSAAVVAQRFRCDLAGTAPAGGSALEADSAAIRAAADAGAERIALIVDSSQQPNREVTSFLNDLRRAVGTPIPIAVFVVEDLGSSLRDARESTHEAWERSLRALGDSRLWNQRLGEGS